MHVGWVFLFVAGFFSLMQQWVPKFWIGALVCLLISMSAVLMFVVGALYETYIMMNVDYCEKEVRPVVASSSMLCVSRSQRIFRLRPRS